MAEIVPTQTYTPQRLLDLRHLQMQTDGGQKPFIFRLETNIPSMSVFDPLTISEVQMLVEGINLRDQSSPIFEGWASILHGFFTIEELLGEMRLAKAYRANPQYARDIVSAVFAVTPPQSIFVVNVEPLRLEVTRSGF